MKRSQLLCGSVLLGLVLTASAATPDPLEAGFLNPPDSAKPQAWWHWMISNITKAGITADLEAMKQIGLGGATIVNVDCSIPPGPVKFMSAAWRELWLDLGAVKNFAEVSLNKRDFGALWKPPFCVNLKGAAKPGVIKLVVKATNRWPNRLIGDEQLPPDCEWNGMPLKKWPKWLLDGKPSPMGRLTFTTWHHWTKSMEPLESGLLGPVTLRTAEITLAT